MSTTPASMAASSGRVTHVGKVREFLRKAPPIISRDFFFDGLRGSGPGFKTDHDIGNRITHAKQTGELISLGRGNGYKNTLSQISGDRPASSVRHINGSGAVTEDDGIDGGLADLAVKSARSLAKDASRDPSVTREELILALLAVTGAFEILKEQQS